MANNFTPVGSEIQVNQEPERANDQFNADVAVMTDGRFFVVFEDDFAPDTPDIMGQFVNADGTLSTQSTGPTGPEFDGGIQGHPAVAQRAGGAAVVVWQDEAVVGAAPNIQLAIINSAGVNTTAGTELDVVAGTFDDGDPTRNPDVATFANGQSIIVWERDFSGTDHDIHARILNADGTGFTTVDPILIDNTATTFHELPSVAASGNKALIVYEDETNDDIVARLFDATTGSIGDLVIIAGPGNPLAPDVAALTDGRYIVVWDNDDNDDIEGRLVDANGVPVGAVFSISSIGGNNTDARVAALPDGGFIVTWTNDGGAIPPEVDNNSNAVLTQRFDSTGAPAGDVFLVNTGDPLDDQDDPAVAVNAATGQAFIVWNDGHAFGAAEDADPLGIRGRAFLATTDAVNGTESDDIIQTLSLGETINGLAGDDVINALGGNDIVHGNAGVDFLRGGLGDDQLFGDAGADRLKGEDGNDLLVGGLGRDASFGGLGLDRFDFNSVNESKVGAALRDTINGFSHAEGDKIDLQTIDAKTTAGGNQKFVLIGANGFHGVAGELRFAGGLMQGDTDGNGVANFEIRVTGLGTAVNGDFVL